MDVYPIAEALGSNPAVYCTTLAITRNFITDRGPLRVAQPDAALRNGTLTFVRSSGRTYGITCQHVVQWYRDAVAASGGEGSYSMRAMLNGFHSIFDRFVQPSGRLGEDRPDIALRELDPDLVSHLGKKALDLDLMEEPPQGIRHALGVGFPESLKYNKPEGDGRHRVALPQVEILAELSGAPQTRFTMCSSLKEPCLDIDYSGMSGGPIFWSDEETFGILGIIYEGGASADNFSIYLFGEIATPARIRQWISNVTG